MALVKRAFSEMRWFERDFRHFDEGAREFRKGPGKIPGDDGKVTDSNYTMRLLQIAAEIDSWNCLSWPTSNRAGYTEVRFELGPDGGELEPFEFDSFDPAFDVHFAQYARLSEISTKLYDSEIETTSWMYSGNTSGELVKGLNWYIFEPKRYPSLVLMTQTKFAGEGKVIVFTEIIPKVEDVRKGDFSSVAVSSAAVLQGRFHEQGGNSTEFPVSFGWNRNVLRIEPFEDWGETIQGEELWRPASPYAFIVLWGDPDPGPSYWGQWEEDGEEAETYEEAMNAWWGTAGENIEEALSQLKVTPEIYSNYGISFAIQDSCLFEFSGEMPFGSGYVMDSDFPDQVFANEDKVLIERFASATFNGTKFKGPTLSDPPLYREPFGEKKELYYFPQFAHKVGKPQFNVAAPLGDFGSVHLNGEWNDRILEWNLGPAFPGAVGNVILQYKLGYGKVELAGATVGIEKTDYDNYARIKLIKTYLGEVRIDPLASRSIRQTKDHIDFQRSHRRRSNKMHSVR